MKYNGVRDDSQSLRDIRDLIAQLNDVNRQLAHPPRATPVPRPADTEPLEASAS